MMEGDKRRDRIIQMLADSNAPISGAELAERLGVSRQVIVQDIALLRAVDKSILSTNKGYILFAEKDSKVRRTFCVSHTDDQIEDELNCIVDNNGKVSDVIVEHYIYGQITVDLIINSRKDVKDFLARLNSPDNHDRPLLEGNKNVDFIAELMEKRREKYEAASDIVIETDGKDKLEICEELVHSLRALDAESK